jgi:hypothetical protein
VSASGNVALVAAGNAAENGGVVTASGLIVDAGGDVSFGIAKIGSTVVFGSTNAVRTLAGIAGGTFGFLNGPALTVGTMPLVADVASRSGISASAALADDIFIQTNAPGQQLTLAGNVMAGGKAIFDTAGGFFQVGTATVIAPVLAIDTTGRGVDTLLTFISSNANASAAANLPPSGHTTNPMRFDNLEAPQSVVLLFADQGVVTGNINVGQLGLSGTGAIADLRGAIGGVAGPTAALIGFRDPAPEPTYLFNDCVIAAATCVVLAGAQPVQFLITQPQAASELQTVMELETVTATVTATSKPSAQFIIVTPQVVRVGRERQDPDAPVINIFDEERLCDETAGSPSSGRERCQESR